MNTAAYTIDSEFQTFRRLATSILVKFEAKRSDSYDYDSYEYADVLALYMQGKLSRYGLTKYYESHWNWNKSLNSLSLAEVLTEADKYNPKYEPKEESDERPTDQNI